MRDDQCPERGSLGLQMEGLPPPPKPFDELVKGGEACESSSELERGFRLMNPKSYAVQNPKYRPL